jgi:hypothetical protein
MKTNQIEIDPDIDASTLDFEDEHGFTANQWRSAATAMLAILQPALAMIRAAKNEQIGYAQLLFAFGLEDRSMRDVAAILCVDVKCISDGARKFVRENGLPLPACMKSEEASRKYSEARTKRLTK